MRLVDASGIEVIDHGECLRLLSTHDVGRLGVVVGQQPLVLPVNYAMAGEDIVFRSGPGSKLDSGTRSPACFEIDEIDRVTRSGWSVLAVGRLEEVTEYDGRELERLRTLRVTPWVGGERSHWLRLVPSRISGRRVGKDWVP